MDQHRLIGLCVLSLVFLAVTLLWIQNDFDVHKKFVMYDKQIKKPKHHRSRPSLELGSYVQSSGHPNQSGTITTLGNTSNVTTQSQRQTMVGGIHLKPPTNNSINILIFKNGWQYMGRKPGVYTCRELGFNVRLSYSSSPHALKGKHIVVLYLRTQWDWYELLKVRPPNQVWIFYSRESPLHDHGIMPPDKLQRRTYNWTMTYRSDSTIQARYGLFVPGESEIAADDNRNWAENKTKLVAWMASNCNFNGWPRTPFVKALSKKYLHVDMYGKCGSLKCPKDKGQCPNILSRYKFYLALENSVCTEYITEKFWRNALLYGSVPIVFGANREDYERLAPPDSFIHLSDFESPEELRDYLLKLDANDTLYNRYFEWKKRGRIEIVSLAKLFLPGRLCKMAGKYLDSRQKLSEGRAANYQLPELKDWWKNSCSEGRKNPVVRAVLR